MATLLLKTEKITPLVAETYLKTMETNRRLRNTLVARYAEAMSENQWKLTGEPIKFNNRGELIDGQHRLAAIVQSGKTIAMDVRRDLHPDVFMDLDTGAMRSPGDLLQIAGYHYTINIASAIQQANSILEVESGVTKPVSLGKKKMSPSILLEWAGEHQEELTEAVKETRTKDAKIVCSPPSLHAALYFLFAQYNRKAAREFYAALTTGLGFEHAEHDPIYMLRKQLLSFKGNKNIKRPAYYKAALIIKAWNAYQNRETIQKLKYTDTEAWPEISRRRGRVSEDVAESTRSKQARRRKQIRAAEDLRRKKVKK